jgi:hypothetical protein
MRALLAVSILLLASSEQIARGTDEAAGVTPSAKQSYAVQCRVIAKGQGREGLAFAAPKLTVNDGEKGVLRDITETPFVVAIRTGGDKQSPVIQIIKEGTTIELTVTANGENEALVDVSADFAGSVQPEVKKDRRGNSYQAVHQSGVRGRAIESVTLGKKPTLRLSDNKNLPRLDVELTITLAPDEAAVARDR